MESGLDSVEKSEKKKPRRKITEIDPLLADNKKTVKKKGEKKADKKAAAHKQKAKVESSRVIHRPVA